MSQIKLPSGVMVEYVFEVISVTHMCSECIELLLVFQAVPSPLLPQNICQQDRHGPGHGATLAESNRPASACSGTETHVCLNWKS